MNPGRRAVGRALGLGSGGNGMSLGLFQGWRGDQVGALGIGKCGAVYSWYFNRFRKGEGVVRGWRGLSTGAVEVSSVELKQEHEHELLVGDDSAKKYGTFLRELEREVYAKHEEIDVDYTLKENNPNYQLQMDKTNSFTYQNITKFCRELQHSRSVSFDEVLSSVGTKARVLYVSRLFSSPAYPELLGCLQLRARQERKISHEQKQTLYSLASFLYRHDLYRATKSRLNYMKICDIIRDREGFQEQADYFSSGNKYIKVNVFVQMLKGYFKDGMIERGFRQLQTCCARKNARGGQPAVFVNHFLSLLGECNVEYKDYIRYVNIIMLEGLGSRGTNKTPLLGHFTPNAFTFKHLLPLMNEPSCNPPRACRTIIAAMVSQGFRPDAHVIHAAVKALSHEQTPLSEVISFFTWVEKENIETDVFVYTSFIELCLKKKKYKEALFFYKTIMIEHNVTPNPYTEQCVVEALVRKEIEEHPKGLKESNVTEILNYADSKSVRIDSDTVLAMVDKFHPLEAKKCRDLLLKYISEKREEGNYYTIKLTTQLLKGYLEQWDFETAASLLATIPINKIDQAEEALNSFIVSLNQANCLQMSEFFLGKMAEWNMRVHKKAMDSLWESVRTYDDIKMVWEYCQSSSTPLSMRLRVPVGKQAEALQRASEYLVETEREALCSFLETNSGYDTDKTAKVLNWLKGDVKIELETNDYCFLHSCVVPSYVEQTKGWERLGDKNIRTYINRLVSESCLKNVHEMQPEYFFSPPLENNAPFRKDLANALLLAYQMCKENIKSPPPAIILSINKSIASEGNGKTLLHLNGLKRALYHGKTWTEVPLLDMEKEQVRNYVLRAQRNALNKSIS
eukprot:Nk52_evm1s334 gene=Nk52_evmTU1s334